MMMIPGGIRLTRNRIFNGNEQIGGDRPDKRNLAILLTDGESNRGEELTISEAQTSKDQGTHMLVVAIGNKVQLAEVSAIASYPSYDYLFRTNNFDDLPTIGNRVLDMICTISGKYIYLKLLTFKSVISDLGTTLYAH